MSLHTVSPGDRVRLEHTSDPYTNLEPGDTGTVTGIDPPLLGERQVQIDWDSGSSLALIAGEDRVTVIDD